MKKIIITATTTILLLSSCGSYNATEGAYTGATFGHVIGSAIGGITGGPRGHDWGTLIGTVGGAVVGAAVGNAVDNSQQQRREEAAARRMERRNSQRQTQVSPDYDDSGYDPQGRGNDIITFDGDGSDIPTMHANSFHATALEIRNARLLEAHNDGRLTRGEECRVVFEIMNNSDQTIYDVRPFVEDATGNRHIRISQNLKIENIGPKQGVRYTASIVADSRLRNGEIVVRLGVAKGNHEIKSQTQTIVVPTAK